MADNPVEQDEAEAKLDKLATALEDCMLRRVEGEDAAPDAATMNAIIRYLATQGYVADRRVDNRLARLRKVTGTPAPEYVQDGDLPELPFNKEA